MNGVEGVAPAAAMRNGAGDGRELRNEATGSRTSQRLAKIARRLHKWVGAVLAVLMATIAVTGGFVALKNELEYLQPKGRSGAKGDIDAMLPPARIAEIVLAMNLPEAKSIRQINRIELRPAKRMYKVRLEQASAWASPREIQVDAITGKILNDGLRGDQLWMDLHSFAVFGDAAKIGTMIVAALALVWLSLSGLYLFVYPSWVKRRRAAPASRAVPGSFPAATAQ